MDRNVADSSAAEAATPSPKPPPRREKVPLILDTDIGTDCDDAIALAYAAIEPRFDLRAVTVVNGNVDLRARIARHFLDLAGRHDVPVGRGHRVGLSNCPWPGMPIALGNEGQGLDLPETQDFEDAEQLIVRVLDASDAPVHIATIGAVTNVANALSRHEELLDRIAQVTTMGGAFTQPRFPDGSTQSLTVHSEFNLGCDPLAASILCALPVPLRLVPVDVTVLTRFTEEDLRALTESGPLGRALYEVCRIWIDRANPTQNPNAAAYLHDPLAVAGILEPGLHELETMRIAVWGRPGKVFTRRWEQGRLAEVGRSVRDAELRALLVKTITGV